MKREKDLIAQFQKEMDGYGLKVDNSTGGMYEDDCFYMRMNTKSIPARGQKKLMDELRGLGYTVVLHRTAGESYEDVQTPFRGYGENRKHTGMLPDGSEEENAAAGGCRSDPGGTAARLHRSRPTMPPGTRGRASENPDCRNLHKALRECPETEEDRKQAWAVLVRL